MEYWQIEFWENENGVCRVEKDLLEKMSKQEKFLFASLQEKMDKFTKAKITDIQKLGYLTKIKSEENMWELKFSLSKNEIRFLGCLVLQNGFHIFIPYMLLKRKIKKL